MERSFISLSHAYFCWWEKNDFSRTVSTLFMSAVSLRVPADDRFQYFRCVCVCAKSLQSCLTLGDTMDYSLPGSSVDEILQARKLEWVAVPSSRGSP